ncbi:MAG TPA: 4-(cytidine 5'-diphospho)-2-C-methyl-D-erythritol kinase [Gemmataceae bacterium]|nr:4-(cytidine 5'-diphospho)-2-C-methyl-D-erythritol kinase [Gemmataceae bacterium]
MLSERRADGVVVWAPAKVNLFLEVLGKRADGYHEIATLMVAVSLYDTLEFKEEASPHILLRCDHPDLSPGPDNLVYRAADLLRRRGGVERGVRISLRKRIPMAAGLAGGSADAAATLWGLNLLWRLGRTRGELAALGAELGSDVPFFFWSPAAWCTGRGERVAPVALGRPLDLVLVCPEVGLSTAAVYGGVTVPERPQSGEEIRAAAAAGDVVEIGRRLHNRLQPVAERLCPEVAELHRLLAALGPAGQLMSGSGTSLFALCRNGSEAQRVARALRRGAGEGTSPGETAGDGARRAKRFVVRSCF